MLHIYPLCYALVARLPPERQRQQAGQKRRTKPERGQSSSAGSAGHQSGRRGGHQQPKVCPVRPVRPVCHAHCRRGAEAVTHLLTVDLFKITNLEIYERTVQRQGFQGFCRKEEIRTSNTWGPDNSSAGQLYQLHLVQISNLLVLCLRKFPLCAT